MVRFVNSLSWLRSLTRMCGGILLLGAAACGSSPATGESSSNVEAAPPSAAPACRTVATSVTRNKVTFALARLCLQDGAAHQVTFTDSSSTPPDTITLKTSDFPDDRPLLDAALEPKLSKGFSSDDISFFEGPLEEDIAAANAHEDDVDPMKGLRNFLVNQACEGNGDLKAKFADRCKSATEDG